jgi:hypothetical protein
VPTFRRDGDGPQVHDIEGDLQRLRTMRELNVRKVVLRDVLGRTGLSAASQQALDSVLRQLLELEGIGIDPETPK